ncbi:cyclic di-GMP signal transduction protein [Zobellella endophytica]|uniref:Cyclic di-GMP signal transduction protein n=1 Tax=Zobellella endophytica TaxID=2116700 RepID=A0A2P7R8W0_9GAMM|nr:diguanylate cyclase [Zobellella endophytica]PSJ46639.1 cyclic di-GMP signal transduction protein [Zobellella endophytica]
MNSPLGYGRYHRLILVSIAVLGICLSIAAYYQGVAFNGQLRQKEFERLAQIQALRAQQLIDNSKELLDAFRGMFIASELLTREEYRRFVLSVLENHPEIITVHWAPRIVAPDRAEQEGQLAAQGLAPIGIFDITPGADHMFPSPDRPEYFPILFAEPREINQVLIGLDALQRPDTREAVQRAASQGQQASSPPFRIIQDPEGPLAMAIYQPIYTTQPAPPTTPAQYRQALQGLVILMLRPELLLQALIDDDQLNSQLRLLDISGEQAVPIYPRQEPPPATSNDRVSFLLELPGRQWQLELWPSTHFLSAHASRQPLWLLLSLLLLTALLVAFVARSLRDARALASANRQLLHRQKELDELAYYDQFTGLPNRMLLTDRVSQAFVNDRRQGSFTAICLLDLDGFKEVNDSLGHQAGDQVLACLARRMQRSLRATDTLARLGGDEFVIVLQGLRSRDMTEHTLQRLSDEIRQPISLVSKSRVTVSASLGAVLPCNGERLLEDWLSLADNAMYRAKNAGKGRYMILEAASGQADCRT